jgi:hypothetical protein
MILKYYLRPRREYQKILEALRIEMWLGLIPVAAFVIPLRLIGITREDDRTLIETCIKPVGYPHFFSGAD